MAYGSIFEQRTPSVGIGAAIINGVVNNGETINAGDVVNLFGAATLLSAVTPGSIIKLKENGTPVDFYVAKHDYESSLNGTGRTLVVRKDCYDDQAWDNGDVNAYASSDLDSWFNSTYKNMLDTDIRSLIGTTKIRYTPGNGNKTVGTLERAIFALSPTELNKSESWFNVEGTALEIASSLQIAYMNGSAVIQWTRSPNTNTTSRAACLYKDGSINGRSCHGTFGSRPAFTLPSSIYVSDDGTVSQTAPQLPGTIFTKQNTPYQAIALSSGTSGQTIQVIYSGITNASWVTAGQKITSTATGVQGYGVKNGMLEVFPYYRPTT